MDDFEIRLPADEDILENGLLLLKERVVKHQGIWIINLNDQDSWPSHPHGDRKDEPEKLNLLTGDVFSKASRNHIYTLSNKSMRYIFHRISKFADSRILEALTCQHISYLKKGDL
jgi:hypothetical protein